MAQDYKGNPDSAGLGWFGDDRFTVGYIDEVNGPGAVEVPAFVPTRHELIQLAKYWAGVEIDLDFSWFVYQETGSSEIRRGPFASRRIARIAEALGEEEVAEAVRQACDDFAKGMDPRTWTTFRNGTLEERRALQDELARELRGTDAAEIAEVTELMRSLGLDCPSVESGNVVRFAILPFSAVSVTDPPCIIVPILHYLNAGASDGRYEKNDDGSIQPIQWAVRHVGFLQFEMKRIQRLLDPKEAASDVDIVMRGPAFPPRVLPDFQKALWKLNPDLAKEAGGSCCRGVECFGDQACRKAGVTMIDNFQTASTPIR